MVNNVWQKKKRQIILENFNNRPHEVSLVKLQEISNLLNVSYHTFFSLNNSCGDTIHLLIQQENNSVKLALFASEQQACLLTVVATNIFCRWMENKKIELAKIEIKNIEKMLQGQKFQLDNCPQMKVFEDLPQFPQRIECVNLVLRGIKKCLNN